MITNSYDATKASPSSMVDKTTNNYATNDSCADDTAELERKRRKVEKKLKDDYLSEKKRKKLEKKLKRLKKKLKNSKKEKRDLQLQNANLRRGVADTADRLTVLEERCDRFESYFDMARKSALKQKAHEVVEEIHRGGFRDDEAAVKEIIRLVEDIKKIS